MENTDIIPFKPTRHHYLNQLNAVVALGGGHGLGRLLSALSFLKERLTGIVATTIMEAQPVEYVHNKG